MILDELTEPGAHWFKAVVTGTDEIAGFVKWVAPRPGTFPNTQLPAWPEGADAALCDKTFGAWAGKHRELMQDRGHWCKWLKAEGDVRLEGGCSSTLQLAD